MAVTVTYTYPVAGTTPPVAAQAANENAIVGTVTATLDADTTAVITHNWGLSAAQLAAGQPFVRLVGTGATEILSGWYVSAVATNTVTLTKATTAGSGAAGAQLTFTIDRPHSIVMDGNRPVPAT